jgi:predicted transcriptional regulator
MQARSEAVGHGIRGYMTIVYSVLSVCLNSDLQTHIMFRCNLNSKQLHFYLESLVNRNLLERDRVPPSARVEYRTTTKGRKYIETYEAMAQLLSEQGPLENEAYAQNPMSLG